MATGSRLRSITLALVSLIAISGFIALGVWQLLWVQWQDQLIEQATFIPGSELATITDLEAGLEYGYEVNLLRVRLNGYYRHDLERYIAASKDGSPGYQIITPFIEERGYIVLVDRGWVAEADRKPNTRPDPRNPEGKISVNGISRYNAASMVWLYPAAKNNVWSWYDRRGIANSLPQGLGENDNGEAAIVATLFVQIEPDGEPGEGRLPYISPLKIGSSIYHLLAAAISFLLALALAIYTIRYFWTRRKNKKAA